ncbi:hypothetical protein HYPDE_40188 [Hyphomicrobium denitrificans 1NES1]|uniref:Uncharacterized protein n=1 Tax=Hyphomicrobium denitrificans 1NES1 TaxID=670307 RepID=N0BGY5_9HYPH|nr:hypothetical protein [Hyphomicrobium denitrificans]AGK59706.1 hypothetical protein HYPDE_40188 [Hyphomicrobium denitrificans 1NES1]
MRFAAYIRRLSSFAETVHRWLGELARLDGLRREKVALYAEEVAATLSRAAAALGTLETTPDDRSAIITATRELGRIAGYLETIMAALDVHLDGRKRAGVKRRLEHLKPFDLEAAIREYGAFPQARRLTSAEGYFRALADTLRA